MQGGSPGFRGQGFKFLPDQNGRIREGIFPGSRIPTPDERRVSAAMGYLDAETRKRPNLTISTDTQVKRAAVRGHAAASAHRHGRGQEQEFPRQPRGDPLIGRDPTHPAIFMRAASARSASDRSRPSP